MPHPIMVHRYVKTFEAVRTVIAATYFRLRRAFGLLCALVFFMVNGSGCDQPLFRNDLEAIQAKGVLKVITRNNGTCYYEGPHGSEGFEYDLAAAFADHLGVKLEIVVMENEKAMVASLLSRKADMIAAGFVATEDLRKHLAFGPSYQRIRQFVVGRRGDPRLKKVSDLVGKPLWILAGAYHEKRLNILKKDHPDLSWLSISNYEPEELLEMVGQGVIPLTVTDETTLSLNRRYYPELMVHFAIDEGQDLVWVIHQQSRHLQQAVHHWFQKPDTASLIERLKQHYYSHLEKFDYVDITTFRKRLVQRLPKYRGHFMAAAKKHNLDWKLVAAQSYQESHWNPKARSFTGVRGMMMLTLDTARYLGIKNRLDPKQSIEGGTRFLAKLYSRIDENVTDPDRTFMALAAYNVGWGHLEDARRLTASLGKNPDSWTEIRSTLPLLRLKKYYRNLSHGYARGSEPVRYVDRIRTYHKVLLRWEGEMDESRAASTPIVQTSPF